MATLMLRRFSVRSLTLVRTAMVLNNSFSYSNKVTHTGQIWNEEDSRNARFIDRNKQVNDQFAINLVSEEPVVAIDGSHTWCDGGNDALGHPKVYINLDKPEDGVCGYCGKRFISKKHSNNN